MEFGEILPEIFLPIPGYEGIYEVSDSGNLKRLYKVTVAKCGKVMVFKEMVISPKPHSSGYVRFNLTKNGTVKTHLAHICVASVFIKNEFNLPLVNHKNGIKWDNRKVNLEWNTSSMNNQHAIDTGLNPILVGEKARNSKISNSDVLKIKHLSKSTAYSQTQLAYMYGVDQSTISKIVNNKERIK